jgi:hypothetical protein
MVAAIAAHKTISPFGISQHLQTFILCAERFLEPFHVELPN